jgi:hypothetical protein
MGDEFTRHTSPISKFGEIQSASSNIAGQVIPTQVSEEYHELAHCGNGQVIPAPTVDTPVRDKYTKFCQEIWVVH